MSSEFNLLKQLFKDKKIQFRFQNSSDPFGIWLYWMCKMKPSPLNLFGYLYYVYFILTMDWLWLPLAIFIGFKFGWLYGILTWILHHIMQKNILSGIGQGFMVHDFLKDEDLFDAIWANRIVTIWDRELKKFILPTQDWRIQIHAFQSPS